MKLWVTNIPVNAFISAWVEIPDATPEDKIDDAIKEALCGEDSTFAVDSRKLQREGVELDEGIINGGWEFNIDDTRK